MGHTSSATLFGGEFNDTYAFRESPTLTVNQRLHQDLVPDMSGRLRPGVRRCQECGELLNKWDDPLLGVVIADRRYDVSFTHDGVLIVSPKFKDLYDSHHWTGLSFRQLPDDPQFFAAYAIPVVTFDSNSRGTRFTQMCPTCGHYESVIGATPVYLKGNPTIPEDGFVRTDIEFASEDEKSPLIICGASVAKVMKQSRLKGLQLVVEKLIIRETSLQ